MWTLCPCLEINPWICCGACFSLEGILSLWRTGSGLKVRTITASWKGLWDPYFIHEEMRALSGELVHLWSFAEQKMQLIVHTMGCIGWLCAWRRGLVIFASCSLSCLSAEFQDRWELWSSPVQWLSRVRLFATPWIAARQACLSSTWRAWMSAQMCLPAPARSLGVCGTWLP